MEVNERRTVVGGSLATVSPPNRGERSTRMALSIVRSGRRGPGCRVMSVQDVKFGCRCRGVNNSIHLSYNSPGNSPGAAAHGTIILAISIHQFHHSRAAKGLVDIQSLKKSI